MVIAEQILRDGMAGSAGLASAGHARAGSENMRPATAGMDRPISLELRRRRLILRIAAALGAVGSIAALFALGNRWLAPSIDRDRLRTTRVERGPIEEVV